MRTYFTIVGFFLIACFIFGVSMAIHDREACAENKLEDISFGLIRLACTVSKAGH